LLVTHALFGLLDAAELQQGLAACFFWAHARVEILLDGQVPMCIKFCIKLAIITAKEIAKARERGT